MYDKVIKEVLNINDIPSSVHCKGFITQKLNIQEKKRIYSWYIDSDFFYLNLRVVDDEQKRYI